MESDHWLVRKWPERRRIVTGCSDVTSGNHSRGGGHGLSQNGHGQIGRRYIAGAEKWPKRVAVVAKISFKNSIADGYCGGVGVHEGYG